MAREKAYSLAVQSGLQDTSENKASYRRGWSKVGEILGRKEPAAKKVTGPAEFDWLNR